MADDTIQRRIRNGQHRVLPDVTCADCGKVFRPKNAKSKYCSRRCLWNNNTIPREPLPVDENGRTLHKCGHCGWTADVLHGKCRQCAYAKDRRRRARLAVGTVTADELREIVGKSCGCCHYCEAPVKTQCNPSRPVGFDHVVPFSKGGKHSAGNMVVCCPRCNRLKSDSAPTELEAVLAAYKASRG